jgi:hypothetical protein
MRQGPPLPEQLPEGAGKGTISVWTDFACAGLALVVSFKLAAAAEKETQTSRAAKLQMV